MNNVQIRMLTKCNSGYVILKSNSTKNSKGRRLISHFVNVKKNDKHQETMYYYGDISNLSHKVVEEI